MRRRGSKRSHRQGSTRRLPCSRRPLAPAPSSRSSGLELTARVFAAHWRLGGRPPRSSSQMSPARHRTIVPPYRPFLLALSWWRRSSAPLAPWPAQRAGSSFRSLMIASCQHDDLRAPSAGADRCRSGRPRASGDASSTEAPWRSVFVGRFRGLGGQSTMPTVSGRSMSSATAGHATARISTPPTSRSSSTPAQRFWTDTHFTCALFETGCRTGLRRLPLGAGAAGRRATTDDAILPSSSEHLDSVRCAPADEPRGASTPTSLISVPLSRRGQPRRKGGPDRPRRSARPAQR